MKNIDGYVTKDSLYRLLSNMRMSWEIVDDKTLSKVAQAVADMKPVEAQPVKHGRWVVTSEPCATTPVMHCSNCENNTNYKFNYCPNCGYYMKDGDSDA